MAWYYQKEFVIQIEQGTGPKFLTLRICKSMNDELCVRIRDEKAYKLDEKGRYDMFLQMAQELEARNTKKGVTARPKRNQFDHIVNNVVGDIFKQMTVNQKENNDGAGDGEATHIMVEGISIQYFILFSTIQKLQQNLNSKFEPITIAEYIYKIFICTYVI